MIEAAGAALRSLRVPTVASACEQLVRRRTIGEGPDRRRHSPQVRLFCSLRSLPVLPHPVCCLGRRGDLPRRIRRHRHQQSALYVSCSGRSQLGANARAVFDCSLPLAADCVGNPPTLSSLADEKACRLAPPQYGGARSAQRAKEALTTSARRWATSLATSKLSASTMTRTSDSVPDGRNRTRPESPSSA
jgi:hypothetical protein